MVQPWLIDFRVPRSLEELAGHIGIQPEHLVKVVASASRAEFYRAHHIPKRNSSRRGEYRTCYEATEPYKTAHKNLLRRFDIFARVVEPRYPHRCAHGYISTRSTLTNARIHCGAARVLHADIENFFPTISRSRLVTLFVNLGIDREVAESLSKFATIDDKLPLGLNASPLFANLICIGIDEKMEAVAKRYGAEYSRYADDLSFSGNGDLPTKLDLSNILTPEGFKLSERKFFTTKRGQSHFVTGLSVTDPDRPHVPKPFKRRLRMELYYAERFGLTEHIGKRSYSSFWSGVNTIDGSIKYLAGIEGPKLLMKWQSILLREGVRPSSLPVHDQLARKVSFFFDESDIDSPKGPVLAIGCVAIEDLEGVEKAVETLQRFHEADPFFVGKKATFRKKGLHYVDITPEIRQHYVRILASLPIRGFMAYDFLNNYSNYKEAYIRLVRTLLYNRFIYYDRAEASIVYEENSKLTLKDVETGVGQLYKELESQSSRRPTNMPKVIEGKKREEPCLSIADTLLGVMRDYAIDPTERNQGLFERLRDQYRLIISLPANKSFTRKEPFKPWPQLDPTNS